MSASHRFCFYHPQQEAIAFCRVCGFCYCRACLGGSDEEARCPACDCSLIHIEAHGQIKPFWEMLGVFFRQPWSRRGLALVALCALTGLLPWPDEARWVVPLIAPLVVAAGLAPVLANRARGRLHSLAAGKPLRPVDARLAGRLSLLILVALVCCAATWVQIGPPAGLLVMSIAVLLLQGSIILLSRQASLDKALGPGYLANVAGSLGKVYALLWLYLLAVMVITIGMCDQLLASLPGAPGASFAAALVGYVTAAVVHGLAYVSLQYRQVDLFKSGSTEASTRSVQQAFVAATPKLQMAAIDMALKNGDFDAVEQRLRWQLQVRPQERVALDRLTRLCSERGDWDKLAGHTVPVLRLLLSSTRDRDICRMLRHRLSQDAEFELRDGELLHGVSRTLYFNGEYRLVLRLLNRIEERQPDSPRLVDCLLLIACSLANGLHKTDKAMAYLKHIRKQYPQHSIVPMLTLWIQRLESDGRLPEPAANFMGAAQAG